MTKPTTDFTEILWARTLPKITATIIEDHDSLINCDGNWTQVAVDFAVLLNIHDTPLLEQLGVLGIKLEAAERQVIVYETCCLNDKVRIAGISRELNVAEAKLEAISNWAEAYPLDIFPEPDLKKAAIVLKANGMTLDAISASNMRHVLEGVKDILGEQDNDK